MTREEAITIIDSLHLIGCGRYQHENDLKINVALDMAIEALKDRPQGEWIKNDDFTCSECGYRMIVGDGAYNFCPNCGADNRGVVM